MNATGKSSHAISDFQQSCHGYYICYSLSVSGLEEHAKTLASIAQNHESTLWVGTTHPDEGHWHAKIKIADAIRSLQRDSDFPDRIAKSFITAMYSEWDELYRHGLAEEVGVPAKLLMCDLMGDLRLIRHCLIHKKSEIYGRAHEAKATQMGARSR